MRSVPMNGIAEHDFVTMMIPHHQGAIDMAQALLLSTKDSELRNLCAGNHYRTGKRNTRDARAVAAPCGTNPAEAWVLTVWKAPSAVSAGASREKTSICPGRRACFSCRRCNSRPRRQRVHGRPEHEHRLSVIDPATNTVPGQIRLGNVRPDILSALYKGVDTAIVRGGITVDRRDVARLSGSARSRARSRDDRRRHDWKLRVDELRGVAHFAAKQ